MNLNAMAIMEFIGVNAEELIQSRYTHSLLTLIAFFVGAKFITFVSEKYILKLTSKTKTEVDDILVKKMHLPISFLLFILGVKLAIRPLALEENINTILHHILSTLSIVILIYILIEMLEVIIDAWVKRRTAKEPEVNENIAKISCKTGRAVSVILGLLFILNVWGVQIGPLLASLGIIGVAVAFGLQNTLGNVFGGVSLLLDRSIKVGDVIKVDDSSTGVVSGTVIDVGLRSTRIRTWSNEVVLIPNGKLATINIKNYVLPTPVVRIEVPFSVAYGSDIGKVKKVVMKEINKLDNLDRGNEPMVMLFEMGASSLNFKALVWIKSYKDEFVTKERLNCMIYNSLNENKIEIPFPQMDVHLKRG